MASVLTHVTNKVVVAKVQGSCFIRAPPIQVHMHKSEERLMLAQMKPEFFIGQFETPRKTSEL